jgi:hypothetical protein
MRQELKKLKMVRGSAAARGATVGSDNPDSLDEAPQFEGAVRDIIESEREEARKKRTDALRDRFSGRHGEALDELVAVAGLNQSESGVSGKPRPSNGSPCSWPRAKASAVDLRSRALSSIEDAIPHDISDQAQALPDTHREPGV